MEKIVPQCIYCREVMRKGQNVYLTNLNQIVHTACYSGEKSFIKDRGTYELILAKYPHYFDGLKV